MKSLVTGGAGFIGSNIVDRLINDGHDVIILDNLCTGREKNINPKAKFYNIDITDSNIGKIFKENKIDLVFHLAAQIDVRKSVSNPIFDATTNIIGTINLLNMIQKYSIGKIIYSSSGGAVYGEPKEIPADEKHTVRPLAPYGISKHCPEHYIEYYHDLYGLKYTILRYANVYGPRQDPLGEAGVIAIFMGRMLKGDTPIIFGDGNQTRDYVFVGDVVNANISAINNGDNQIYNIGTGKETSVNEIYEILSKLIKNSPKAIYEAKRPGEVERICLNTEKAKKELSWVAKVTLEEGIKKTLEFNSLQ